MLKNLNILKHFKYVKTFKYKVQKPKIKHLEKDYIATLETNRKKV